MAYGYMNYVGPQLLNQGMTNMGEGIAQYLQNKRLDAAATSQLEVMLPALMTQYQQFGQQPPPELQQSLDKLSSGNARLKDKLAMIGQASTAGQMLQQQVQNQVMAYQLNRTGIINRALMDAFNQPGAQIQPPQGGVPSQLLPGGPTGGNQPVNPSQQQLPQGPQSITINPPVPLTINSPEARPLYMKALGMAFGDPEKASQLTQQQLDAINKQRQSVYDQAVAVQRPTGRLIYAGPDPATYNQTGVPTMDLYHPEVIKGPGTAVQSYDQGSQTISFSHGATPPQPVIFSAGDGLAKGGNSPDAQANAMATINRLAPENPNAPDWQKQIVDAQNQANGSNIVLSDANLLVQGVRSFTQGGSSRWNLFRGSPQGAAFLQMINLKNPAATLETIRAFNTQAILAQIRNASGQTIGGRMLQTEFEGTAKLLSESDKDNRSQMAAALNVQMLMGQKAAIDNAYANAIQTMPAAKASALVRKQFGAPVKLIEPGMVDKIEKDYPGAIQILRTNPNALVPMNGQMVPAAQAFDAKFGTGMSELAQVNP